MAPVYADATRARASGHDDSETPLLDAFDREIDGPSIAERQRAEDLAAERALSEGIERDREAAAGGLTEDEERALFGP